MLTLARFNFWDSIRRFFAKETLKESDVAQFLMVMFFVSSSDGLQPTSDGRQRSSVP